MRNLQYLAYCAYSTPLNLSHILSHYYGAPKETQVNKKKLVNLRGNANDLQGLINLSGGDANITCLEETSNKWPEMFLVNRENTLFFGKIRYFI